MLIIATVLLGPGSAETVGDAAASVAQHVDAFVFIESGGGQEALFAAQEAAIHAGKGYTLTEYEWRGDYGHARQFALDRAREDGADYAITLDPDERLALPDNLRDKLAAYPGLDLWIVQDKDTHYFKERIIRCAASVHWHGTVCEYIAGQTQAQGKLAGHFWELPKDAAAERRRWERGVIATEAMIAGGDDCFRWRRHKGSCLVGLGRHDEGLVEYTAALGHALSDEEKGWIRYLICELLVLKDDLNGAFALAHLGMAEHAGFLKEFAWILAYVEYCSGDNQNASRWAQIALFMPDDKTRTGFRGQNGKAGCEQLLALIHGGKLTRVGPERTTINGQTAPDASAASAA